MNISIGKVLGLSRCSTDKGIFSILALDHRNNLRKLINPESPQEVDYSTAARMKSIVVDSLIGISSALLLDPEYGINDQVVDSLTKHRTGLIISVEESGYLGDATKRKSNLIKKWGVEKVKRIGASAVKLLIYYNPKSITAHHQEELVKKVSVQCVNYDIPLFLEVLTYSTIPGQKELPSKDKCSWILDAVTRFGQYPIDIFKLEYPLGNDLSDYHAEGLKMCAEISKASKIPWLLLSAGVDFQTFLEQAQIACQSGASGVMAGRAIWKEALELTGQELNDFLKLTAPNRMSQLSNVCREFARPWTEFFDHPGLKENWYKDYRDFENSIG